MAISISSTKGLSRDQLVVEIVKRVQAKPAIFKYLSRIFSDYKKNDEPLRIEIFSYIDRVLHSPRLTLLVDTKTIEKLKSLMKSIYQLNPDKFSKVRGEVLENTVYHFGPVTKGLHHEQVFIEPIIRDGSTIIGDSDIKCDFVFYQGECYPIEFIECKANIANIIPHTLPFDKAKRSHKNKINYLDSAFNYLARHYSEPNIYFACYNLNYSRELHNLQENWGFINMDFVNAEEIIDGKNRLP